MNKIKQKKSHLENQQKPAGIWRMPSRSSNAPDLDNWGVNKNNMNLETKVRAKKPCFLDNFSQKTRLKDFSRNPEVLSTMKSCGGLLGDRLTSQFFRL